MKQLNFFQSTGAMSTRRLNMTPARFMLMFFSIIFLNNSSAWAQCSCPEGSPIIVGSNVSIPTLTDAIINFPGFNNIDNQCVRISGQFRIDNAQTWEVDNSNLLFDANAEVRVEANSILDVRTTSSRMGQSASITVLSLGKFVTRNSVYTNCLPNIKWNRIVISGSGELQMDSCAVNQAITGVDILPNAIFTILNSGFYFCSNGLKIINNQIPAQHLVRDNLFYDCNIGIHIAGARNVNILNNTYRRNNIANMTGIYCAPSSNVINITGGDFLKQTYGIDALLASNIAVAGANFIDCRNGVNFFTTTNALSITGNEFTNTTRHAIRVHSHNNANIQITGNGVFTGGNSSMSSIIVGSISGGVCSITGNNPVQIPGVAGVNGIEAITINSATFNINTNVVNQSGSAAVGGISLTSIGSSTTVNNNIVTGNANMLYHIRASAVSNNMSIQGNQLGLSGGLHANRGLELLNNPGAVNVCCNQLSNSNEGLYITGQLNGAFIGRNTFNAHPTAGLFYDLVTSTGAQQFLTGNDWRTYTGACPALFNGSIGMANATRYTVTLDLFPQLYAGVCTSFDPQEWFLILADIAEATCATGGQCGPYGGFNGGSEERNSLPQAETFSATPNPANQALTITFPKSTEPAQVTLYDLNGKNLMRETCPAENVAVTLRTDHLPEGVYLVRCEWQNQAPVTQKVVIKH
ncbi:MAG: T9SS type A sorting domain-containing protein [Saprospiraceae bacterium]